MKVSVIIPTFNRGNYVAQAIDSVLQQTEKDIEVIVVDDDSTDNTREIVESYQDKVHYIHTEHGGPAHARNVGLKNAQGEYIAFLDSDDLYFPYKVKLQVSLLKKYPEIGMVCTELSAFDDDGYWDEFHLKKFHTAYNHAAITYENIFSEHLTIKDTGLAFDDFLHRKVYMGNIFNKYYENLILMTNTVMFRKAILGTVGLHDERYYLFDEYEFVLRITKYFKVAFIDVPTYKYRYHHDQISLTDNKERKMQILVMR